MSLECTSTVQQEYLYKKVKAKNRLNKAEFNSLKLFLIQIQQEALVLELTGC